MGGCSQFGHTLKMQGTNVPHSTVEALLRELDQERTEERGEHRPRRRAYRNNSLSKASTVKRGTPIPCILRVCKYNPTASQAVRSI